MKRDAKALDADKKAIEDFVVVKEEMEKCGIGGSSDSTRFLNVLHTFRRYAYDPSKIMGAFADRLEIEDVKRLKQEIDQKTRVLDVKLEELGLGDFEQLRQVITIIMTLANFGIDCDKIIGLSRNLDLGQIRREQWERRGRECGAQYMNPENNGGGGGQEHGYSYPF